jgi:membrane-associated phospholipid phosphatase
MRCTRVLAAATFAVAMAASGDALASDPGRVKWDPSWQRFTWSNAALTAAATLGSYVAGELETSPHPNWRTPVLLDLPVRNVVRGDAHLREVTSQWSDVTYRMLAFMFPYVVDAGVVAFGVHRNPDVAAQMLLIDIQSLSVNGFITLFATRLVGRERPYVRDCDQPEVSKLCDGGMNQSFFSGHASTTFTSAGLTCVHHKYLPLYGGGAPDTWACVWALSVASATAAFRLIADRHWLSDVVVGAAVGFSTGYLLPSWLHYRFGKGPPKVRGKIAIGDDALVMMPTVTPVNGGAAVGVTGTF